MPDLSDLAEDLLEAAVTEGVQSHTADGETVTAYPLKDILAIIDKAKADGALSDGGSGWNRLRKARAVPGGAGPD